MGKKDGKKESPPGITINTGEGFMPYLLLQDRNRGGKGFPREVMCLGLFFTSLSLVFSMGKRSYSSCPLYFWFLSFFITFFLFSSSARDWFPFRQTKRSSLGLEASLCLDVLEYLWSLVSIRL